MGKWLFLMMTSLVLMACGQHDDIYYRLNPKALQQAVQSCLNKQGRSLNCEKIKSIANEIEELAYQLQTNPQHFGQSILQLQENIAEQELSLEKMPNQSSLKQMIDENKQQLAQRLAIVKWLESPER